MQTHPVTRSPYRGSSFVCNKVHVTVLDRYLVVYMVLHRVLLLPCSRLKTMKTSMMSMVPHCNQANSNRQMAAALVREDDSLPLATFPLLLWTMCIAP